MHISQLQRLQRREFLRRAAQLSMAGAAAPLALHLSAMGEASAATASDYKALVCIFLYGGNDQDNTFIPYDDASHAIYRSLRNVGDDLSSRIYWAKNPTDANKQLVPLSTTTNGHQYAFQPAMSGVANLFESGQVGVMLNVGPLAEPTTKTQFKNNAVALPPKLFSHNDQFSLWQSATLTGVEGSTKGWGGRMGDIFLRNSSFNRNAHFTCINATGNALFMSGTAVLPYQVASSGPVVISGVGLGSNLSVFGRESCKTALNNLLKTSATPTHWMEKEWMRMIGSSLDNQAAVTTGISSLPNFNTAFNNDTLSGQMNIIAKLIAASRAMEVKRQVFFASLGSFDLHDNLMANHSGLLQKLNDAMYSFYKATEQLGIADKVTTFTASDFGRTLTSNGDGSDHGWGSHHLVMGGAVDGKKYWGTAPTLSEDADNTVGQGRLLPSTSVDEFAAALARWMGVAESDLSVVLPNIERFSNRTPLTLFKSTG